MQRPLRRQAPTRSATRSCARRGVEAHHLPGLFYLPSLSVAVVLFARRPRGDRRRPHLRRVRALHPRCCCSSSWPLESMGWIINLGQRALASAGRELRLARAACRRCPSPSDPQTLPPRPARRPLRGRALRLRRRRARCCAASTSTSRRARSWPSAAPPARASRRCSSLLPRFYDPTAGARAPRRRRRCATLALADAARRRRASSPSARSCSPSRCATTCSPAAPTRPGTRSSAACEVAGVTRRSSTSCRTATTR